MYYVDTVYTYGQICCKYDDFFLYDNISLNVYSTLCDSYTWLDSINIIKDA